MFGFQQDIVGQGAVASLGHVSAEAFHDVADFMIGCRGETRKHGGGGNEG